MSAISLLANDLEAVMTPEGAPSFEEAGRLGSAAGISARGVQDLVASDKSGGVLAGLKKLEGLNPRAPAIPELQVQLAANYEALVELRVLSARVEAALPGPPQDLQRAKNELRLAANNVARGLAKAVAMVPPELLTAPAAIADASRYLAGSFSRAKP